MCACDMGGPPCRLCGGTPLDPNYQADAWPTPAEEREQAVQMAHEATRNAPGKEWS